jgi:lipoprotein-releasing system ATP-binding protein
MVRTENIHKSFGKVEVLKGINLSVNKTEIVSIVGASGAGKSTLLHIIGTIDKADKGEVFINDINTKTLKGDKLSRFRNKHIGFVFQFHHLLPEFTALENICIPAFIAGETKNKAEKRALELLEFMNMKERSGHKPAELSGGEQQRVAIARALINNPTVILADEPSGNLDSVSATNLHKLFFDLRDNFGQTFVIVTHNKELSEMADRKLEIKDGIIIKENNTY